MDWAGAGEPSDHMRNTMPHFITQDKTDFPPRLDYGSITRSTIPRTVNHRELQKAWQSRLGLYRPYLIWKALASRLQQLRATKTSENIKAVSTLRYAYRLATVEWLPVSKSQCFSGFGYTSIDTESFNRMLPPPQNLSNPNTPNEIHAGHATPQKTLGSHSAAFDGTSKGFLTVVRSAIGSRSVESAI